MEGNNDMASASTSGTQQIGGAGEAEVPDPMAIFGNDDSNDISHTRRTLPPKA